MKVIPIVPVRTGRVTDIQFENGLKFGETRYDIFEVMTQLGKIYDCSLFLDLNSYSDGDQQIELLKTLCEVNTIWVDPGAEFSDEIIDPLVAGGDSVLMGTSTLESLSELEEAVDLSDRIIPVIHWAHGEVIREYKRKEEGIEDLLAHLSYFEDIGLESSLIMDLPRIASRSEFDPTLLNALLGNELDMYLAGGITEKDALFYSEKGFAGILLCINDMLSTLEQSRNRRSAVEHHELPEYEPAVQLSSIGMPEFH
jgi:uncharacterized protein related to proFAR isomerase